MVLASASTAPVVSWSMSAPTKCHNTTTITEIAKPQSFPNALVIVVVVVGGVVVVIVVIVVVVIVVDVVVVVVVVVVVRLAIHGGVTGRPIPRAWARIDPRCFAHRRLVERLAVLVVVIVVIVVLVVVIVVIVVLVVVGHAL